MDATALVIDIKRLRLSYLERLNLFLSTSRTALFKLYLCAYCLNGFLEVLGFILRQTFLQL